MVREKMSQPCWSKPKGWPGAGGPYELPRSQSRRGSIEVNSCGNSATTQTTTMIAAEIQKIGRRRSFRHASDHIDEGAPESSTASTAPRPVSAVSAKKCSWWRRAATGLRPPSVFSGIADPRVQGGVQQVHEQVREDVHHAQHGCQRDDGRGLPAD